MKKVICIGIVLVSFFGLWISESMGTNRDLRNIEISGIVRDDSGNLVSGVLVSVRNIKNTETKKNWSTNTKNGEYSLKVPQGVYDLTVKYSGRIGLGSYTTPTRPNIKATQNVIVNIILRKESEKEYAPIVWLADDVRLHPMLPHPFAFDGIDNDGDGLTDLKDPCEVSMGNMDPKDNMELKKLINLVEKFRGLRFSLDMTPALKRSLESCDSKKELELLEKSPLFKRLEKISKTRKIKLEKVTIKKKNNSWELSNYEELKLSDCELKGGVRFDIDENLLKADDKSLLAKIKKKAKEEDGISISKLELIKFADNVFVITGKNEEDTKGTCIYIAKQKEDKLNVYRGRKQTYVITNHTTHITIEREDKLPPARVVYYTNPADRGHRNIIKKGREIVTNNQIYQYWFYYLFDEGLGSHMHDSEHAFVYVDEREVQCVVGAGHRPATANNILIAGNVMLRDALGAHSKIPISLPKHIPILVELGKHASAPDRNMDGRFDWGMDANWHPYRAWGSRDGVFVTGITESGEMRPEYSFPRNEKGLIVEESWGNDKSSYCEGYKEAGFDEKLRRGGKKRRYALFPLYYMRELYELLKDVEKTDKEGTKPSFSFNSCKVLDNDGNISPDLRSKFSNHGIELSENAILTIEKKDSEWRITDYHYDNRMYIAKKENDQLKIYKLLFNDQEEFLYDILGDLDEGLDEEYISKSLRKEFKDSFSENAIVTIEEKGSEWRITDCDYSNSVYVIRKENDKLNVYEDKKKEIIENWLSLHKSRFWGEKAPNKVEIDDIAFDRMREWPDMIDPKRDLWEHNDHEDPDNDNIFKLWLFPRIAIKPAIKCEFGNRVLGLGLQFGSIAPCLRRTSAWHKFHANWRCRCWSKMADVLTILFKPGTLELYYDLSDKGKWYEKGNCIYNFSRGVNHGFYGGLGWGKSILPQNKCCLVASGGITFRYGQSELRAGLVGEIHNRKFLKINPISIQFSLSFAVKLLKAKHPLTAQ